MLSNCIGALRQREPFILLYLPKRSYIEQICAGFELQVLLGFTSRYWVHWDAKPKRSGRDIRFYVPGEKDGT